MDKIRNFFWLCSGANRQLLTECPTEASKYAGIGATVFFTGLFAGLAAFYAAFSVFENAWTSAGIGLIWGAMIFNLDRYIVSSMRKSINTWQELKMALPRIILAVMIAIVISKPLEMRVFNKEINGELVLMQQEFKADKEDLIRSRFHSSIDILRREIATLKKEITDKTAMRDRLRRIARQEADGTGGTMRRNAGPIYRIKKSDAEKIENELALLTQSNNKLIKDNYVKIAGLEDKMSEEFEAEQEIAINGLASRLDALNRLTKSSPAIWIANWFIILLFIAIEIAPVLVKLISNRGPYDDLLEAREYDLRTKSIESMTRSNAGVKKRMSRMPEQEKEFIRERLDLELNRF